MNRNAIRSYLCHRNIVGFVILTASAVAVLSISRANHLVPNPSQSNVKTIDSGVLKLKKGDHICLVGNALGERMQHFNYWETLLHARFPQHNLVVRNLCFPADEPFVRLRSLNFGTPDDHLRQSKADVILYFFGFNESFAGKKGVKKFVADLTRLVTQTKASNYSGKGPPRIVLISPIAHEDIGDNNVDNGNVHNKALELYTKEMAKIAKSAGVGFVDMFAPTKRLFQQTKKNLTLNGVHLSENGYKALAPILDKALFGTTESPAFNTKLKVEIDDRNFHWWHRYRAVNGYYIYGGRAKAGFDGTYRNREVMVRELEVLAQMCENRDRRIWAIAQGKSVPANVDDSNTLPLIQPKSNVGKNKRNDKKVGPLKYRSSKEQRKTFTLAPGYGINIFATEEDFPELANPVAINFDNKGRLWVAVMPSYPQWKPKTKLRDKLLILEESNGDGRADKCTVFADELHLPTGFEFGHGGVYVAQQPDLLFLKDTDGDDKADTKTRLLMGFDSTDSHHGLAAFEWGPGGALYFQEGTFKQSQVETPHGPKRLSEGGVWRYEPRTHKFGVHVAFNFANPWGHVFDRWGQNFLADASPGLNYWATPISGFLTYPDRHPGGQHDKRLKWPLKKKYPTFVKKRIRPSSGCEIVSSRNFPSQAQGNFLLNNVIGDRAVLQFSMHDDGAGFSGQETTKLVSSKDGNFRPVDLQFGPDGGLYICDWHNALIGHLQHNIRDPNRDHKHGRIWRVTYTKRPLVPTAKIAGQPIPALLDLLKAPEDRTRYRVRRELAERNTKEVVAAIGKWVASLNPKEMDYAHHVLEALWLHQAHNAVNVPLLTQVLSLPNANARAAATRVICRWHDRIADAMQILQKCVNDPHPRVRLEAVRACSFIHTSASMEVALQALNHEMDYYVEYTLFETLRSLEQSLTGAHAKMGHHHGATHVVKPLVFLNTSAKIVQFQLDRLSNAQLVLVERTTENAKFSPVYQAILTRPGMSALHRRDALNALTKMKRTDPADLLVATITHLDETDKSQMQVARQLAQLILKRNPKELASRLTLFRKATKSDKRIVRLVGHAGLISGAQGASYNTAAETADFLASIELVPSVDYRTQLRDNVVAILAGKQPLNIRRAAIRALAHIPAQQEKNFALVARYISAPKLRAAAVKTLLQISKKYRPLDTSRQLVKSLVSYAEKTPVKQRTTDAFLDAVQFTEELLAQLPLNEARAFRKRLREVTVRIIRLATVPEEMRYDKQYFAVEAGRPVQLILQNDDLMPHNLVVTKPGAMRDVAELAAAMESTIDKQGRQFVPQSDNVLFASKMVQGGSKSKMLFTAPKMPGEYPFVCTFPGHWTRMYGVMVVVKDLDSFLANPKKPADPLGNNRVFVKSWQMDDFKEDLSAALRGRNFAIGRKIFEQASCIQCHKMHDKGGLVGPDLTEVYKRWKGDDRAVLRELLVPSHKIEPKYTVHTLITKKGTFVNGIITKQDGKNVTVIANPLSPKTQVIPRSEIANIVPTPTSMMPKGLLDHYTRDEIFELIAYLRAVGELKKNR